MIGVLFEKRYCSYFTQGKFYFNHLEDSVLFYTDLKKATL